MADKFPDVLFKGFPSAEIHKAHWAAFQFYVDYPDKFGPNKSVLYGSSIVDQKMPDIEVYRTKTRIVVSWIGGD